MKHNLIEKLREKYGWNYAVEFKQPDDQTLLVYVDGQETKVYITSELMVDMKNFHNINMWDEDVVFESLCETIDEKMK